MLNPHAGRLFGDSNNDSVAMRLTYGEVSFLLTADMEQEAERRLIASGQRRGEHSAQGRTSRQQNLDFREVS